MQAVNKMGVGHGEEVCRKGCPYIRQLANVPTFESLDLESLFFSYARTSSASSYVNVIGPRYGKGKRGFV